MGSGKHTNMDITLGFKGPSLEQNMRDFQIRMVAFRESGLDGSGK